MNRGLWEVGYRDVDGVRRRPLFATEESAHQHAAEVFRRLGQALAAVQDRDTTLRDYATRWLATVAVDKAPQTHASYKERLERHVLPALGHLKLRALHRAHIKAFLTAKRGQGHSKNSVRLMRAALSSLLSDAADDGIIPTNPALQLGRPRGRRADTMTLAERLQKIRPMTREQRDAFLKAGRRERPYGALFATLALRGPSPGRGLRAQAR